MSRHSMKQDPDTTLWMSRVQDTLRHLEDLQHDTYEGAASRTDREVIFRRAFDLVTPVAVRVLSDINEWLLGGEGTIQTKPPHDDSAGGLKGEWQITWPRLESAINKYTGRGLDPVRLIAVFPAGWTHGHFERPHAGFPADVTAWPMQITTEEDAERQEPVLRVIAETELHERIYQASGDWQLTLPLSES